MITVRFPNGQAVQYNDGTYVEHYGNFQRITTKKAAIRLLLFPMTASLNLLRPACLQSPCFRTE